MNDSRRTKVHARIRKTIIGSPERPRLSVYRSLGNVYAQLIDDSAGKTLGAASSLKMTGSLSTKATEVGKTIAAKAKELKIVSVSFDRGGFPYQGSIKILCDAAREAGLKI